MEYLVTMTTHVLDGTPDQAVDDVRAREAARSRDLAAAGHLVRVWRTDEVTALAPHPNDPALIIPMTPGQWWPTPLRSSRRRFPGAVPVSRPHLWPVATRLSWRVALP